MEGTSAVVAAGFAPGERRTSPVAITFLRFRRLADPRFLPGAGLFVTGFLVNLHSAEILPAPPARPG